MDITVTPRDGGVWYLTDLLGRSMGHIRKLVDGKFIFTPAGQALETMSEMKLGPFYTLDETLAQIETHTRGVCRLTN